MMSELEELRKENEVLRKENEVLKRSLFDANQRLDGMQNVCAQRLRRIAELQDLLNTK